MLTFTSVLGFSTATLAVSAVVMLVPPGPPATVPFDEAILLVEHNVTDGDAEVVVSVDADQGLARFRIVNPCGDKILDMRSEDTQDLGIRKIALETPEPSLDEVLDAYPEGWYRFYGKGTDGQDLFSLVYLSHELPGVPSITFPLDGAGNVPTNGSTITWSPVGDAASYFLELENDDLGVDIKSNIAGGSTSFGFPSGWLAPDTEYQLGLASRADNGNLSVVEIHFTTAP